ncbi:molybdenum cofactor biosynthesis protein MoaE [Dermacoccaceae bacterium W4C1]
MVEQVQQTQRVRLAQVRDSAVSVDEVLAAISGPGVGGIALFVGTVRRVDEGRDVQTLEYEAHPSADDELHRIATQVLTDELSAVAVVHRTGLLQVGDLAVVVGVAAAHRGPALDACHALIDAVKVQVPIWKRQAFDSGETEWVGLA